MRNKDLDTLKREVRKKAKAIDALVATGDERVADILDAMLARKLHRRKADGAIFMTEGKGDTFVARDPVTGAVASAFYTRCTDCHGAIHGSYETPHLLR